MLLDFSLWDLLRMELMSNPGQIYKATRKDKALELQPYSQTVGKYPARLQQIGVLKDLATEGSAFVVYKGGEFYHYLDKIKIFLGTVEFIGTNQYGGPKLRINGRACNNMKSISRAIFGEELSNGYVRDFIKPYYKEEIKKEREIIESALELGDFQLVQVKKNFGTYYPVISYRGNDYNGVTKLTEAIPQLARDPVLLDKVFAHIGWKTGKKRKGKPRYQELIEKLDIIPLGNNCYRIGEAFFDSRRQTAKYIRDVLGEPLGTETARKMFDSLDKVGSDSSTAAHKIIRELDLYISPVDVKGNQMFEIGVDDKRFTDGASFIEYLRGRVTMSESLERQVLGILESRDY